MSATVSSIEREFEHNPTRCAAGECAHAVSARVPCRCPQCDETTAEIVAGYARDALLGSATTRSQTTARFAERTFDRFIQAKDNFAGYEAAVAVANDPTRGLALHGDVGLGKSHLAAAIVNACVARGIASIYVGVDDLLARIRATYSARSGTGGEGEHQLIERFAAVPVLALDDFGKEALSDWTVRTLFAIVNRRYEHNLPLIITSNFDAARLATRKVAKDAEPLTYASTMDRVAEMVGTWVEMRGRSRR